jgi:hypothetical protein
VLVALYNALSQSEVLLPPAIVVVVEPLPLTVVVVELPVAMVVVVTPTVVVVVVVVAVVVVVVAAGADGRTLHTRRLPSCRQTKSVDLPF